MPWAIWYGAFLLPNLGDCLIFSRLEGGEFGYGALTLALFLAFCCKDSLDFLVIEPYKLIFKWSAWYVWGYCLEQGIPCRLSMKRPAPFIKRCGPCFYHLLIILPYICRFSSANRWTRTITVSPTMKSESSCW